MRPQSTTVASVAPIRLLDVQGVVHQSMIVLDSARSVLVQRLDDLLAPGASAFMSAEGPKVITKSGKERNLLGDGVSAPGTLPGAVGGERLKIVEDKRAGMRVQNLEEMPVKTPEEALAYVQRGIAKRATAETACNAQSSRSHCVFTLTIHTKETTPEGEDLLKVREARAVRAACRAATLHFAPRH